MASNPVAEANGIIAQSNIASHGNISGYRPSKLGCEVSLRPTKELICSAAASQHLTSRRPQRRVAPTLITQGCLLTSVDQSQYHAIQYQPWQVPSRLGREVSLRQTNELMDSATAIQHPKPRRPQRRVTPALITPASLLLSVNQSQHSRAV